MFSLGKIFATSGALAAVKASGQDAMHYVRRHQRGDWGDVCRDDAQANEDAVRDGTRILSVYHLLPTAVKVYVITEHDRSVTTVLLASEY